MNGYFNTGGSSVDLTAPGPIGGTTPGTGAFSTLTFTTANGLTVTASTGTLTVQNGVVLNSGATSGTVALLVSPSFTTPTLGVASATSIDFGDVRLVKRVSDFLDLLNTAGSQWQKLRVGDITTEAGGINTDTILWGNSHGYLTSPADGLLLIRKADTSGASLQVGADSITVQNVAHNALGALLTGSLTIGGGTAITNIRHGVSGAMTAGAVTVTDTKATASTRYFFTTKAIGTVSVPSDYYASTVTASTSFVITSSQVTDTSTVSWVAIEP